MIFVGSKVFTHARYWQIKKICMHDFFFCGGGGAPRILGGGGTCPPPPPPRSYAPALHIGMYLKEHA